MSNLSKQEFLALDISGKNYLSWILYAEVHLSAASLGKTIIEGNKESLEDRSKALIFLRRHLDEALKSQYLTVKDPYTLWTELKGRFDHQKSLILPCARYEWMHLRLLDFKSVSEYNSALFPIFSRLKLCGETVSESDLLEKTYSTFIASNIVLQQQYRERRFTNYSELISCLLVVEQNKELLMQNKHIHPTCSTPVLEANAAVSQNGEKRYGHRLGPKQFNYKKKGGHNSYQKKGKINESLCHRCGSSGHWASVCRTLKHLVDLYKASLQAKEKDAETNFAQYEVPMNNTHLDILEFKNYATSNEFDDIGSFINDV